MSSLHAWGMAGALGCVPGVSHVSPQDGVQLKWLKPVLCPWIAH